MPSLIAVETNYESFASNATQISEADRAGLEELQTFYRSEVARLRDVWFHKVHQGRSVISIGDTAREYDRMISNLKFVEQRVIELRSMAVSG